MTGISPTILLLTVAAYFLMLYLISFWTSRQSDTNTFFNANQSSPWPLVALGMIGTSLSGVTFISIPGVVGGDGANQAFSYMQMVFGYLLGYLFIATVLMPIYYKMKLTSIYEYLHTRFGFYAYKSGAFYFLLSRLLGASLRLYLVAIVLHKFVLQPLGYSFSITVIITLVLIWVYTNKSGIKTIVWTDTLQTLAMIFAVIFTSIAICNSLDIGVSQIPSRISEAGYGKIFFFEKGWSDQNNFFKQFLAGALITIVMTGLDQDMMQKNLTCRNLRSAQKNMFVFSILLVFANLIFLSLGALLYLYANQNGITIPDKSDYLHPLIALNYLSPAIGLIFIIGLIAAAYSSADSALTALTTSFCIDFLNFKHTEKTEHEKRKIQRFVHFSFSIVLFIAIIIFYNLNNDAVINALFKVASYTYGPLLGIFALGIFSKIKFNDNQWVLVIMLLSPLLSYLIDQNSAQWFGGFKFGFTILAVNGMLTALGLIIYSRLKT